MSKKKTPYTLIKDAVSRLNDGQIKKALEYLDKGHKIFTGPLSKTNFVDPETGYG